MSFFFSIFFFSLWFIHQVQSNMAQKGHKCRFSIQSSCIAHNQTKINQIHLKHFSFFSPIFHTDQRCHPSNKKGSCCIKFAGAAKEIIGKVWNNRNATNSFRFRWHRDWWWGLFSNLGTKYGINCCIQWRAVDWCEFNYVLFCLCLLIFMIENWINFQCHMRMLSKDVDHHLIIWYHKKKYTKKKSKHIYSMTSICKKQEIAHFHSRVNILSFFLHLAKRKTLRTNSIILFLKCIHSVHLKYKYCDFIFECSMYICLIWCQNC